jgi:hypothetical protein
VNTKEGNQGFPPCDLLSFRYLPITPGSVIARSDATRPVLSLSKGDLVAHVQHRP